MFASACIRKDAVLLEQRFTVVFIGCLLKATVIYIQETDTLVGTTTMVVEPDDARAEGLATDVPPVQVLEETG